MPHRSCRSEGHTRPAVVVVALAAVLVLAVGAASCADQRPDPEPPSTTATPTTATTTTGATTADRAATAECAGTGRVERSVEQYRDVPGSDADLTTLEVITPELPEGCGPAPVMVWVHGGGWRTGDRRNQLDDKVDLFTSMGWALVSVNYRLSPAVQYPAHDDDVAAAIGWVLDHADDLGVDPQRLSVMGHSAGAGIAAAVATDPVHLAATGHSPGDLRCAVLLDTEGYDVEAMGERGVEIYLDAFGDDPEVWRAASPIRHVAADAGIPRSLVVTRGVDGRRDAAAAFVDALGAAGVEAHLVDARPLTHAQVNDAVGADGDEVVTPAVVEFLDDC